VRVSGGERVALVYPHGEKEVDARQLSLYWKSNSTGRTRLADSVVEAEFRLVDSDVCFWDRVGMLSEHGMPPHALTRFDSLAPDHRVAVIEALRAEAPDPEDLARDNWEQRPSRMATLWEELPLLFLPAKIVTSRYMGTVYYPESDDGFRPAGSLDAVLTRLVLETGGGLGRFVLLDGLQHEATLDAEAERGRLIREQMLKIDDLLVALAPQYPAHGEEFLSVGPAEWEARYRKAWDALADAYRLDAAREAAARLRSMLDDLEWGAWCSRAPDIQVDQDATSLPPVARRDVGRQIAYGVAHAQQEWSGARWLTVWYRDEADAIAAHAQAAEDLASLVAARASLEVSAAEAARDLTRSHVIASPDAAISDPEIPATMTSVSDLKARFNRRR
jgi:hypothetical protein